MAAIMISVDGINCESLSCNKRGVHIWKLQTSRSAESGRALGTRSPSLVSPPSIVWLLVAPSWGDCESIRYRRNNHEAHEEHEDLTH